jgi:hypothetical protein
MSSDIVSPPVNNPQPIRPPDSGASDYVAPYLRGSLELAGPQLLGRLRPFVSASIGGEFGVERDIAKEGTEGAFAVPAPPNFPGAPPFTVAGLESLVRGQGSRVTVETSNLFLGAGIGAGFELELGGRTVRLKPSLQYLWEEIEADGVVQRAVLLQNPVMVPPTGLGDFRLITLRSSETQAFHALGPALELEFDLTRKGSWVMSVFAGGGADFFLGDREMEWTASNPMGESATFSVERDAISYRGGIGLRIRLEQ